MMIFCRLKISTARPRAEARFRRAGKIDDAIKIYGNQAAMLMAFYHYFAERLCLEKLYSLYQLLDIPLSQVLYQIERRGILLDADYLKGLSQEFAEENCRTSNANLSAGG